MEHESASETKCGRSNLTHACRRSHKVFLSAAILLGCILAIRLYYQTIRADVPPQKVSETEVRSYRDFSYLLLDHRHRNEPLCFRGILKDKWPAVQNWQGVQGAAYLVEQLGPTRAIELDGDTPEQRTPPTIHTTLQEYARWLTEHPTKEHVEAYRTKTGLLPDLAEWKHFWTISERIEEDVGKLKLFAQRALGLSVFEAYLWWGPAGGRTGLHADLDPFNVLCQVVGAKKVTLWPPGQRSLLYPGTKYDRGAELSLVDVWDKELHHKFPLFTQARNVSITLEAGDILFIPIGWWHTTETLEHSISVTANMFTWWDWLLQCPDSFVEWLHIKGLWKRNDCTCHEQGDVVYGL